MESQSPCLRATIGVDGRLLSADEPLLRLQKEAGGDLNTPLAVPQLAAIARLATRLGITISRPIVAACQRGDIDMWVRARPGENAVHFAVIDWTERPARLVEDDGAELAEMAGGFAWEIDPQLRFRPVADDADMVTHERPAPGSQFGAYFILRPDGEGAMPMLEGLARRRAFRGQHALLAGDGAPAHILSGFPLFDLDGGLMGFRGKAMPDGMAPPSDAPQSTSPFSVEFGRRLDRSLRQPLGRIIANADSINAQLEGPLRPDYAGYAGDIAAAGRHLLALVDDLADLQAIDRPDFAVAAEAVDLADIARRAAGLLNVKAADRHIRLTAPDAGE
ncbi:MAG: sensor histidine kinase, partial [Sphingobium sp.]